ncbi:hypothetical protein [Piscinibacter koreensis]|uniref:Uncharacterized protein n=1 Tax=Piscinibacter koreensis TaxID=2742824 RepID=A0A7Y6TWN4_9BURK|nr:hypothetical protein [Schlegelella koreensis]NUZ06243.1 hypothetical protein [Schlegelella koreensis]
MNNSGDSGRTRPDASDSEAGSEWAPTRAFPRGPALDEWQPTRAQAPLPPPAAKPADAPPMRPPTGAQLPDAWQETRAQTALATQLLGDESEYLSGEKDEIGRQIGNNERELFVSSDPAFALQQQFEHLRPEFIAVHDVSTTSSRKLLIGIAAASGRAVQKLVIRRQGYGTPLATIEFVDLAVVGTRPVRLYSTEVDADTAARHAIARTLLAHSRLGVLMIGDLPAHALAAALKPLHDEILTGPWPNRQVLLLPLSSSSTIATQGAELGRGTGIAVRTTPQVTRPADAWGFITGSWSRLRDPSSADTAHVPELAGFAPQPYSARRSPIISAAPVSAPAALDAHPAPLPVRSDAIVADAPADAGHPSQLDRYVRQIGELSGVVGCCVFETGSGRAIAYVGTGPTSGDLATHGNELLAAMTTTSRTLGFGHLLPEAAITLGSHHLLLRAVPKHPGTALHVVLDRATSNLTLARLQVQRLDALFDEAHPA